jgi:hypothetical protein
MSHRPRIGHLGSRRQNRCLPLAVWQRSARTERLHVILEERNGGRDGGLAITMDDVVPVVPSSPQKEEKLGPHIRIHAIEQEEKPVLTSVAEGRFPREIPDATHAVA